MGGFWYFVSSSLAPFWATTASLIWGYLRKMLQKYTVGKWGDVLEREGVENAVELDVVITSKQHNSDL